MQARSLSTFACLTSLGVFPLACGVPTDTPAPATLSQRDSSGIRIVENADLTDSDVEVWYVDTTTQVTIDRTAGDSAYELTSVSHLALLENDVIVAFDEGAARLRFFDSTGRHLATHGRSGSGPGEFVIANQLIAAGGDTVLVVDGNRSRRMWFTASQGHIESQSFDSRQLRSPVTDTLAFGSTPQWLSNDIIALKAFRISQLVRGPDGEPGYSHDLFYSINVATKTAHLLADYERERGRTVQTSTATLELPPGGQSVYSIFAAHPSSQRICAARPRHAEISCLDSGGEQMRIRWKAEEIAYPAAMRDSAMAGSLSRSLQRTRTAADSARIRADVEKMYAEREWLPHWLPIHGLAFDDAGNIWVKEHRNPRGGAVEELRYRVFNPAGVHIAFANVFDGAPFHLGTSRVIGVVRDTDDVQRIAVYRIVKRSVVP
jgi:hypothetical protein